MSDNIPESEVGPPPAPVFRVVDMNILNSARLPFLVSLLAVIGILTVFGLQAIPKIGPTFIVNDNDSALTRFLLPNALYILLGVVALFASYIGYRLTVAAGATHKPVIPSEDYPLLAPLVRDGKAESIDQYVRLSSLGKFTGTFTQLGLSGLPLATIFLTLFFSALTLFQSTSFLDLTKLTLGAFIGSFVQRQVERRADSTSQTGKGSLDEATTPRHAA